MFHWGNREYAEENNVLDWKGEDTLFSKLVQNAIDKFAYTITRRFVASDDESIESQEKFVDSYSVLPGMVKQSKRTTRRPTQTSIPGVSLFTCHCQEKG